MGHWRSGSMEPSESQPSDRAAEERLRRLEERLSRASDAAERLMAEAAQAAAGAAEPRDKPPPAGWQAPGDGQQRGDRGDLELLVQVVESLRELIPPELQRRLAEALREVLLAVRALIDWYLERSEHQRREPAEVEDIPIL